MQTLWYTKYALNEQTQKTSTNIRIKHKTKDDLASIGVYGETHDDIIQRLIRVFWATSLLVAQLPKRD